MASIDDQRGIVFSERNRADSVEHKSNKHGRKSIISKHPSPKKFQSRKNSDAKGDFQPINPLFYHGSNKRMNRSPITITEAYPNQDLHHVESSKHLDNSIISAGSLEVESIRQSPTHQFSPGPRTIGARDTDLTSIISQAMSLRTYD